jgi:hypothetical protein
MIGQDASMENYLGALPDLRAQAKRWAVPLP